MTHAPLGRGGERVAATHAPHVFLPRVGNYFLSQYLRETVWRAGRGGAPPGSCGGGKSCQRNEGCNLQVRLSGKRNVE